MDKRAADLHWGAEREGRPDGPALMLVGLGGSPRFKTCPKNQVVPVAVGWEEGLAVQHSRVLGP